MNDIVPMVLLVAFIVLMLLAVVEIKRADSVSDEQDDDAAQEAK